MSIINTGLDYYAECDYCNNELPPEDSFQDAVQSKKDSGWKSRKDASGNWADICDICLENEQRKPCQS